MRDDGDDEKRPKLFWIRVRLGHLGKAETRPQSGRRAVRGTSAAGRWSVGTRNVTDHRQAGGMMSVAKRDVGAQRTESRRAGRGHALQKPALPAGMLEALENRRKATKLQL